MLTKHLLTKSYKRKQPTNDCWYYWDEKKKDKLSSATLERIVSHQLFSALSVRNYRKKTQGNEILCISTSNSFSWISIAFILWETEILTRKDNNCNNSCKRKSFNNIHSGWEKNCFLHPLSDSIEQICSGTA